MQGSVQKRPGKRGVAWIAVYDEPTMDGKRRQRKKTFRTKKEAEAFLSTTLHEIKRGVYIEPNAQTLGDYLAYWLENYAKHNVRPTTLRSYEQLIRVHLLPALGHVPLQNLQPSQLQAFYATKLKGGRGDGRPGGLSPRTVRYLHALLREALDQAVKWDWVPRNVADAAEPPRAVRPQVQTWTAQEARRFLAVAEGDTYSPVWLLALLTGLRRGEILGLRWKDVDLERASLHIHQNLVEIGSQLRFQEPKTASSRRHVALTPASVVALTEHQVVQAEKRSLLGPAWRDNDLVFTVGDGGPIAPRNLTRRFAQLVHKAGLPRIRLHDLRHTHATALLKDGVHAKVVSDRLGHASIAITLDTYSHVLPDMQRHAIAGIDAALVEEEQGLPD